MLRQPMEDGKVLVSRAQYSFTYPASFMLVASMNPCPCGFLDDKKRRCDCSSYSIKKYLGRISGPIMDRIDIHLEVPRLSTLEFYEQKPSESSNEIRKRVIKCRKIQSERFYNDNKSVKWNADLSPKEIEKYCVCEPSARDSVELLRGFIIKERR